jgi:hypothetical protein
VRREAGTGARSPLNSGLSAMSGGGSARASAAFPNRVYEQGAGKEARSEEASRGARAAHEERAAEAYLIRYVEQRSEESAARSPLIAFRSSAPFSAPC